MQKATLDIPNNKAGLCWILSDWRKLGNFGAIISDMTILAHGPSVNFVFIDLAFVSIAMKVVASLVKMNL